MKKKKIIYSLTTRGLFSELNNLVLAKVYADWHSMELVVNTKNWNARFKEGWNDYFRNTLVCRNDFFTAQLKIYSKEKPWIGKIYYNPKEFFTFYFYYCANAIFIFFHPWTELTKDVFSKLYSTQFLQKELGEACFAKYASAFKSVYKYNDQTAERIRSMRDKLGIPDEYIGVHLRRGDKITSGEMGDIKIETYIDEIRKRKGICCNVYIATDDISVIPYLKRELNKDGFCLFYNKKSNQSGFDERFFNNKTKEERYEDTLNTLLDVDVLIHASFFIGTYSSNISRIIPLYLGLDKCISLDNQWDLLYR